MPLPAQCQEIQNRIDGLLAEKNSLSEDLHSASPSQKPGIVAQIRKLSAEISAARRQLNQCLTTHGVPPPPPANVTKIDWTIKTGEKWWSGTDTQVKIEIYRDSLLLKRLNLEPGGTQRLDRGELATYYWVFQHPDGIGVSVSGTPVPYYEVFPGGVPGHLRVKLIAMGDDAWEKDWISSTVYTGNLRHIPGTIDSVQWVEDWQTFYFGRDIVLSTDRSEGFTSLTLNY